MNATLGDDGLSKKQLLQKVQKAQQGLLPSGSNSNNVNGITKDELNALDPSLLEYHDSINNYISSNKKQVNNPHGNGNLSLGNPPHIVNNASIPIPVLSVSTKARPPPGLKSNSSTNASHMNGRNISNSQSNRNAFNNNSNILHSSDTNDSNLSNFGESVISNMSIGDREKFPKMKNRTNTGQSNTNAKLHLNGMNANSKNITNSFENAMDMDDETQLALIKNQLQSQYNNNSQSSSMKQKSLNTVGRTMESNSSGGYRKTKPQMI